MLHTVYLLYVEGTEESCSHLINLASQASANFLFHSCSWSSSSRQFWPRRGASSGSSSTATSPFHRVPLFSKHQFTEMGNVFFIVLAMHPIFHGIQLVASLKPHRRLLTRVFSQNTSSQRTSETRPEDIVSRSNIVARTNTSNGCDSCSIGVGSVWIPAKWKQVAVSESTTSDSQPSGAAVRKPPAKRAFDLHLSC